MKALYAIIGIITGLVIGIFIPRPQQPTMDHSMHSSMTMDTMMERMNSELRGKSGEAFDKAFLEQMIVHHEGAVSMSELALTQAFNPELKAFAQGIIDAQESEITQMRVWQREWFGN